MNEKLKFEVLEEHLRILHRLNWQWRDDAYEGSPVVDVKRPLGNSSGVVSDIIEILGLTDLVYDDEGEFISGKRGLTSYTYEDLENLWKQMVIVLEVISNTGVIQAGNYYRTQWFGKWTRALPEEETPAPNAEILYSIHNDGIIRRRDGTVVNMAGQQHVDLVKLIMNYIDLFEVKS